MSEGELSIVMLTRSVSNDRADGEILIELLDLLGAVDADPDCEILVLRGVDELMSADDPLQEDHEASEAIAAARLEILEMFDRLRPVSIVWASITSWDGAMDFARASDLALGTVDADFGSGKISWAVRPNHSTRNKGNRISRCVERLESILQRANSIAP